MGWLDGYGTQSAQRAPAPAPPPQRTGWRAGQRTVWAEVPCCPHCGGIHVRIRSSGQGRPTWWECRECDGESWKHSGK